MSQRYAYNDLNIIFHHPGSITSNGLTGSQVRPFKILNAFRTLGVNVETVIGNWSERKQAITRIKHDIRNGKRFDFVYSENRTIPLAMAEPHRLPLHPLTDHLFLNFCHRNRIPVSLFYRDVFWRFAAYKTKLSLAGRLITVPLYWFDWYFHRHYVETLYLPSLAMQASIPSTKGIAKVIPLPPGSAAHEVEKTCKHNINKLQLLYIGGVRPPTYDIEPILEVVERTPSCVLTLCCRKAEWEHFAPRYKKYLNDRVHVVHSSGKELEPLYLSSDLMILLRKPDPYLDFAVPVKLFESVGYELPILASHDSEAGRIVERDDLGWTTELHSAPQLLDHIANNPSELMHKTHALASKKFEHTWEARAAQVCRDMTGFTYTALHD